MAEKTRYSDAELEEFKQIILEKLEVAQRDYNQMMASLNGSDSNGIEDTSPTYKVIEDDAYALSKDETIVSLSSFRVFRQLWYASRTRHMAFAVRQVS